MADRRTPSSGLTNELPQRARAQSTVTSASNATNGTSTTKTKVDDASDAESDSERSTSSEEPSSESESEDDSLSQDEDAEVEISVLPQPPSAEARKKLYQKSLAQDSSLSDRLKAFLPQLAAANEELERDREAGRLGEKSLEQVDENGQYIEMNLGLGVLEERDPNKMDDSDDGDGESENKMETDAKSAESNEKDVLGKLMGQKRTKSSAGIQEVPET